MSKKKLVTAAHAAIDELAGGSPELLEAFLGLLQALVAASSDGESIELDEEVDEENEEADGEETDEDADEEADEDDDVLDEEKPSKKKSTRGSSKKSTKASKPARGRRSKVKVVDEDEEEEDDEVSEIELPVLGSAKNLDSFLDKMADLEEMPEVDTKLGLRELTAELKSFGIDPAEMVEVTSTGAEGRKEKQQGYALLLAKFEYIIEQLMDLNDAGKKRVSTQYDVEPSFGTKAKTKKWGRAMITAIYSSEEDE